MFVVLKNEQYFQKLYKKVFIFSMQLVVLDFFFYIHVIWVWEKKGWIFCRCNIFEMFGFEEGQVGTN